MFALLFRNTKPTNITYTGLTFPIRFSYKLSIRKRSFSMTWYLLLLLPLIVAEREPAGQNIIFILVDGFSSTLLNSSQSESSVGKYFTFLTLLICLGIKEMQEHGVQAEYLKPSFPTQTWPNYFTLVTGWLYAYFVICNAV